MAKGKITLTPQSKGKITLTSKISVQKRPSVPANKASMTASRIVCPNCKTIVA